MGWEIAAVAVKWLFYIGLVIMPGWLFLQVVFGAAKPARGTIGPVWMSLIIILTAGFAYLLLLLQVGEIKGDGITGMFDPVMRDILLTTANGISLYWRLCGLLLWGGVVIGFWWPRLRYPAAMAGTTCLAISFATTGHVNSLDWIAQVAVTLHIMVVACWVGSVFLLAYLLCPATVTPSTLHHWHQWLKRYGQLAVLVLVVVLITGAYLYLQLLGWSLLPTHAYQWLMCLKLCLVALMLLVAARHKWRLVPAIADSLSAIGPGQDALRRMRQSLLLEAVLALLLLAIVAVLTTVVGPEMMSVKD
jgi:putative copper resistance protein D